LLTGRREEVRYDGFGISEVITLGYSVCSMYSDVRGYAQEFSVVVYV